MTLTGINIRFLYLICGAKYEGFSSVQVYPKSYCIQHKTKRYSFHSCRLMFIFFQRRRHGYHMAFSLLESVHRIAPPMRIDSHHAILSEKLLHSRKAKRYSFHPYRLMFIFCQRRRHGYHMAFSPLESVHRIAPPVQTIPTSQTHPENCYISCKTKAAGLPPYRLMFIFSNADGTATTWRFLYSNLCMELFRHRQTYLKSCYISRKTKAAEIPPIPLNVYSFQCRRHDFHTAFFLLESVH